MTIELGMLSPKSDTFYRSISSLRRHQGEKNLRGSYSFLIKKGAHVTPLFIQLFGLPQLEGDPQPQPHGAPVIDALLSKAANQSSEVVIVRDIGRVKRQ